MKTKKNQQHQSPKSNLSNSELTRIIHEAVIQSSKDAKEIAKEIDKPYPTLMREINPEDTGAKVGVNDLIPLMKATGDINPLTYLANAMGFVLIPYDLVYRTRFPGHKTFLRRHREHLLIQPVLSEL